MILPNLAAGCSMADMADIDSVEECWEQLAELYGTEPDADGRVPVIPVTYMNSSAALKGFCGAQRRHRLHLVERRRPCSSGRSSAGSGCCSSPTSTSAATPPRRWACRSSRCRCGTRTSRSAATTPQALARRPGHPLARLLLGAQALHGRPDREGPRRVPRRPRDRAPRVPDAGRRRRRRGRLDRLHPQGDRGRPGRHDLRDRHRDQPRAAARRASTRSTRSSASTRWSARARRCTASTPATSPGCSRRCVDGEVLNQITVPDDVARARPGRPRADARGQAARAGRSLTMASVIVVGSGIAGLTAALAAARDATTSSSSPRRRSAESNTRYAQGGIAGGAVPRRQRRGAHRGHPARRRRALRPGGRRVLCTEGPDAHPRPDRARRRLRPRRRRTSPAGARPRTRYPRVLHAGGDATGAAIEAALVRARARERRPRSSSTRS